jgi:hypothetical protein
MASEVVHVVPDSPAQSAFLDHVAAMLVKYPPDADADAERDVA